MALTGFLGTRLNERLAKDSKVPIMLMVAGTTLTYAVLVYAFKIFTLGVQMEIGAFVRIALIEAFYNIMILIIIYPIFKAVGMAIQNIFMDKRIMTREFLGGGAFGR